MKKIRRVVITLSLAGLFLTSCQKDCMVNTAVVVDAGNVQTTQLPADSATLTGMVTAGLTANTTYLWTVVSGPSVPVFGHNDSSVTVIKNLVEGTYVFQFQATNNVGMTGLDTTRIVVTAPVIKTLTLQPANNTGEVVMTALNGTDEYTGSYPEFLALAWTRGGIPFNVRMAVKYDLSSIPANATILSANFYLYSNPTPDNGNLVDANYGADNSMVLQQITTPWDSTTISYFHPPVVTTVNEVQVPSTTSPFLDINIDVKDMIATMISQNSNYGFLVRLNKEVIYTDRCFVSSYNTTYPGKHPKLVITYK